MSWWQLCSTNIQGCYEFLMYLWHTASTRRSVQQRLRLQISQQLAQDKHTGSWRSGNWCRLGGPDNGLPVSPTADNYLTQPTAAYEAAGLSLTRLLMTQGSGNVCVFYKGGYGLWVLTVFSYAERFWFGDQEQRRKQEGRHGPDHSACKLQSSLELQLSALQPVRGLHLSPQWMWLCVVQFVSKAFVWMPLGGMVTLSTHKARHWEIETTDDQLWHTALWCFITAWWVRRFAPYLIGEVIKSWFTWEVQ